MTRRIAWIGQAASDQAENRAIERYLGRQRRGPRESSEPPSGTGVLVAGAVTVIAAVLFGISRGKGW